MNTEKRFWRTSHLLAAGMTRHGITRAVQKKELFKVVHGVWSTCEPTDEIRLGCLAATRPGLVYTAETAAFLYGLTDLSWYSQGAEGNQPRRRRSAETVDRGVPQVQGAPGHPPGIPAGDGGRTLTSGF
mgnify:CR=1 FL=1